MGTEFRSIAGKWPAEFFTQPHIYPSRWVSLPVTVASESTTRKKKHFLVMWLPQADSWPGISTVNGATAVTAHCHTDSLLKLITMELPVPLVLFLALTVSLVVFVPLTGVLVRFRANYNPKGLQLDSDGGAVPYTGPVLRSYFGMMIRVYRLEVRMQKFLFVVQPKGEASRAFPAFTKDWVCSPSILSPCLLLTFYSSANRHQQLHHRHYCSSFHRYGASTSW